MILEYEWYQWILFFFFYCFFGWVFESTYVSIRQKKFVNRGFLRLPMLPLYGTGAIMMLVVSLPFRGNLMMTYIAGVCGATVLEYVTGWGMERLFKMRYWDYSNQKFNVNGYICLSSSVAWGFLTILMTDVLHKPVERLVLSGAKGPELALVAVVGTAFLADTYESTKAALDLAKALEKMSRMRTELDEMQVQLALFRQELREQTAERMAVMHEEASLKVAELKAEAAAKLGGARNAGLGMLGGVKSSGMGMLGGVKTAGLEKLDGYKNSSLEKLNGIKSAGFEKLDGYKNSKLESLVHKMESYQQIARNLNAISRFYQRELLRGNPGATSRYRESLAELKGRLEEQQKSEQKRKDGERK